MTYTPGPWHNEHQWIKANDGDIGVGISFSAGVTPREEQIANSRLMAAAPDLLEACRVALVAVQSGVDTLRLHNLIVKECGAAIAKATGETK